MSGVSLGNGGTPHEVRRVLDSELQTWTTSPRKATMFLSTLAQKKFPDLALNVVDTMRATAVEVNSIHISDPLQVQEYAELCSAVVGAAARSARWTLALWLLQSPELLADPNVFAWNAGISACEAGKEWERALLLFESMPAAGIEPDKVSRNAAISACKSGSNWQLAVNLLRSFDSADVISFGAAITACEKCGMWEEALSLAESMQACSLVHLQNPTHRT
eukprot:g27350.t1